MRKRRLGVLFLIGIVATFILTGCGAESEEEETETSENRQTERIVVRPEDVAAELESPENPSFEKEEIRGISVVVDGETVYQMNYTPQDDKDSYLYWDMIVPYSSTAIVDTEAMYKLYEMVAGLDLTVATQEQLDTSQNPEEFDTYITLNYYDSGDSETQEIEPDKTLTLLIGEKQDSQYYCVLKGYEEKAMMLNAGLLDSILQQDPYNLILKIPYVVNVASVKEVDITYGGKDYQMTLDGDTYKINKKKVDSEEYLDLYSNLMQPMLDGKIPEDETLKEDREPLISIRYIRNMDGVEDYEVYIYPYGEDQYTVSVNGEENFFLSAEDVEALEEVLKESF